MWKSWVKTIEFKVQPSKEIYSWSEEEEQEKGTEGTAAASLTPVEPLASCSLQDRLNSREIFPEN